MADVSPFPPNRELRERDQPSQTLDVGAGICRQCGGDSKVIDTNPTAGPIRRRRECIQCGWRWTTREYSD
jgi:hypothetical protein